MTDNPILFLHNGTTVEFVGNSEPFNSFAIEKYECIWLPPEKQLKPNTCGTCAFFRPPNNNDDWQYLPWHHEGAQGSCGNMKATLGGSISTGRDSRCKHYTPL